MSNSTREAHLMPLENDLWKDVGISPFSLKEAWVGAREAIPIGYRYVKTIDYASSSLIGAQQHKIFYISNSYGMVLKGTLIEKVLVIKAFVYHRFLQEPEDLNGILEACRLVVWKEGQDKWMVTGKIINIMQKNNCKGFAIFSAGTVYLPEVKIQIGFSLFTYTLYTNLRGMLLDIYQKSQALKEETKKYANLLEFKKPLISANGCLYLLTNQQGDKQLEETWETATQTTVVEHGQSQTIQIKSRKIIQNVSELVRYILTEKLNSISFSIRDKDEKWLSEREYMRENAVTTPSSDTTIL